MPDSYTEVVLAQFIADMELYLLITLVVFIVALIIQMFFWLGIHSRIVFFRPGISKIRKKPVSVIICARNEEENLRYNLPLILEQKYPEFEVIIVNDCSTDNSGELLKEFSEQYSNLRVTTIKEDRKFKHGKKLALTLGIKAASHDWLLLTDADCKPESKHWIAGMQQNFTSNTSIVLGYGGYFYRKGILNLLIRFETVHTALQYFSYAIARIPYMGVGRNLAFRKTLFFENRGFASHSYLNSGDDDLFVNQAATKNNTKIEIRQDYHTRSAAKTSLKEWYYQKKRHLTTGPLYNTRTKILLGSEISSRIFFYLGFIFLIIKGPFPLFIGSLFLFRLVITIVILKIITARLNEKLLLLPSPIFDAVLPFIYLFIHFTNFVAAKRSRWK